MNRRAGHYLILTLLVGVAATGCTSAEFGDGKFESLTLARTPGMGFCPQLGTFISANVDRQAADDAFQLSGSLATEGDPVADECIPYAHQPECLVAEPVPATPLSGAQVATLEQRIAAIPAKDCERDPGLACDPCVVTTIAVDGHEVSGDCCGDLNDDFAQGFAALVAAIDLLRP